MSLHVDASAFLKLYLEEPDSEACERLLADDPVWIAGRHAAVEVRRGLACGLSGEALEDARSQFEKDWARVVVIELDITTCEDAAALAETHPLRTLDALHLAAARRLALPGLSLLTYDQRLAEVARAIGMTVIGG